MWSFYTHTKVMICLRPEVSEVLQLHIIMTLFKTTSFKSPHFFFKLCADSNDFTTSLSFLCLFLLKALILTQSLKIMLSPYLRKRSIPWLHNCKCSGFFLVADLPVIKDVFHTANVLSSKWKVRNIFNFWIFIDC